MRGGYCMRLVSVVSVLALAVASGGCGGRIGYRGLTVKVEVPVRARVQVDVDAAAAARARAGGQVHAEVAAEAAVEPPAPEPVVVAVEGAPVAEFFGIPLDGAADVVFVLDRSGSMTEPARGRAAELHRQPAAAPGVPPPADPAVASDPAAGGPPGDEPQEPAAEIAAAPPPPPQKIEVARRELTDALRRLDPGTRINVIFFNAAVEGYAPGFIAVEDPEREDLIHFVETTPAVGRTALAAALRTAFLMNPRRVVLLSDGLGNLGDGAGAILRDAREAMRGGVRIDAIGLGVNQDDALLRALAAESGGLYQAF